MRLLLPITILLLFDWYAFQAFQVVSASWSATARSVLAFIYWSVPAVAIGTLVAATVSDVSKWDKEKFSILRAVLMAAYLSKFLMVIFLLFDDFRRLALEIYQAISGNEDLDKNRSELLSQIAVSAGLIPFLLLTYGVFRNRYRYKIFRATVKLSDLPQELNGLKIIQISDIHSGSFTQKVPIKNAIDLINKEAADLVFFTGDLVNNVANEIEPYIEIFSKIKSKYGVFSITGNHDYGDYVRWENAEAKKDNFLQLIQAHQKLGWKLLLNEHEKLEINGATVAIIGVENFSGHRRFSKYGDLSLAYAGAEQADLKLLLSHDPSHWQYEIVKDFTAIDITFSGHTHGFQFGLEIPGWFKWSPVKYFYKEWAGLYQAGQQFLYVNRGFGFLGYPGRVGILPEITVMELKNENLD